MTNRRFRLATTMEGHLRQSQSLLAFFIEHPTAADVPMAVRQTLHNQTAACQDALTATQDKNKVNHDAYVAWEVAEARMTEVLVEILNRWITMPPMEEAMYILAGGLVRGKPSPEVLTEAVPVIGYTILTLRMVRFDIIPRLADKTPKEIGHTGRLVLARGILKSGVLTFEDFVQGYVPERQTSGAGLRYWRDALKQRVTGAYDPKDSGLKGYICGFYETTNGNIQGSWGPITEFIIP